MVSIVSKDFKLDDVKLIIFDKDGTFIDIHTYWGRVVELRAQKLIQKYSLSKTLYTDLCDTMGYNLHTKKLPPDSPVGLYSRNQVQEILENYFKKNKINISIKEIEEVFKEVSSEFIQEQEKYTKTIPEAIELIKKLKNTDAKMVVVTSDSKENAKYTVKKNDLEEYFEGIYGAQDSKTPKTSGEIIDKISKLMNIKKENIICIGDTYDDFLMFQNSGIKACVNVSTGVVPKSQHQKYNKCCVCKLDEIDVC